MQKTIIDKAQLACTRAIIEKHETKDLCYYEKLDVAILKVYEAIESKEIKQILDTITKLELLIKPERYYGTFVEGIENT